MIEETYIPISLLNDFIFCPYSIYLHQVYMESDESLYHATPQIKGKTAHETTDHKTYSSRKTDITSMPVLSEELGIYGKIDLYKQNQKILIEKKRVLKQLYRGQYYQLWAQYFCMIEMGYEIDQLAFYEISTNRTIPIPLPSPAERNELENIISRFRTYSPHSPIHINVNKCAHCIYCNLCDKTDSDHVYS